MRNLFAAIMIVVSMLGVSNAGAHGDAKPKHGGVATIASDMFLELVVTAEGATIYLEDHGNPFPTAGITGKLSVLSGAEKTEAALAGAGENRLTAKVKITRGSKVVAALTLPSKKTITARFVIK